jgi:DNA-binding IclR family transcriptional regulator
MSAAGRVFAAWMPKNIIAPILAEELKHAPLPPALKSKAAVEALLAEIRAQGYAATNGQHKVAGVEAAAAPIFNFKNEITMAVLVVGVQGMLDISPEGKVVQSLKQSAEKLSLRLGAHGEPKQP